MVRGEDRGEVETLSKGVAGAVVPALMLFVMVNQ